MSRTPLTFLPYHQGDIVIRHLSYYRKPSHLTMWPWPSRGKSGSSWPLLRRPCTGTWCWRTTATCCLQVRTAAWVTDQVPSQRPFLSQLLKALECLWCSVSSLAQKKWVYSPFCEKSLDSVGCEIVLASLVAFCHVHRPQGKLTGSSQSFLMNRFSSKHTRGTLQIGSRRTMDDGWWNPLSNPFRWVRDQQGNRPWRWQSEKSHRFEGVGGSVRLSPDVMFPQARYWMELAIHFSRVLPYPRLEPASLISSELAGRFFTTKATWEALTLGYFQLIPLCMY